MDKNYNLFGKLRANIEEFDQRGVYLIGKYTNKDQFDIENRGRSYGYYYMQKRVLEDIDFACASKYRTGPIDTEGNRKTFVNIVNFHADVAINQIDVNTSNYILTPTSYSYRLPVFFMDKKFKEWADEESYDDQIDELCNDFVRKGSCVVKRTKDSVERVPLRSLRNTQTAKTLEEAARGGGYVIIENEMTLSEMEEYPKWKVEGIEPEKPHVVFERYAMVPYAKIVEFNGGKANDKDWDKIVLSVQILIPDIKTMKGVQGEENGKLAYIQDIKDFPLEEAHYEKIDGRWLGRGEVERQLENQLARNLTANGRRRNLQWAAKKIFQSTDDGIARNLVIEAKDGDVLQIKQNSQVTAVDTSTKQLSDFQSDENMWKENSQQISFSFEAASGQSMPSGTPFRLGAILEAAVSKYFKRKQDTFSKFLIRSFFDQIIPIFKKQNKYDHELAYGTFDDGFQEYRDMMIVTYANSLVSKEWMNGNYISYDEAAQRVSKQLEKHPYLYAQIPENYYDDAHCYMRLNINEPINADIESLTTLYQTMVQNGDPRAERVLSQIFLARGKNAEAILGPKPVQQPMPQGQNGAVPSNVQIPDQQQPQQ